MADSAAIVQARQALGRQLAELRRAAGHTQDSLASLLDGYSRSTLAGAETGGRPTQRGLWECCDRALETGGALTSGFDEIQSSIQDERKLAARQAESDRGAKVRDAVGERSFGHYSHDDEEDAMELARRISASDVTSETLDRLEELVDDLASQYPVTSPAELLGHVRRHLSYVAGLVDRRKTLAGHRRLLIVGGWLSLLGATLHIDLNQYRPAAARLRTAAALARHAEHAEIHAWCYETDAWRALTVGDYPRALELSRTAQRLAPGGSSAAIQAIAQEGRVLARMNDAKGTYEAIHRVGELVTNLPRPEHPEHHFRYDPDKSTAYMATTLAWVGDPAAESYARETIARLGPTEDVSKWPRRVAAANLDLALTLLVTNRLDEACDAARRAILSGRVAPSNHWRALEVVTAVEARQLPEAKDLRETYENLSAPG